MISWRIQVIPFRFEQLQNGTEPLLEHLNQRLVEQDAMASGPVADSICSHSNGCTSFIYRYVSHIQSKMETTLSLYEIRMRLPPPIPKPTHMMVVCDPVEKTVSIVKVRGRIGKRFANFAIRDCLPSKAAFPIQLTGAQLTEMYEKYRETARVTLAEWKYMRNRVRVIGGDETALQEIEKHLKLDRPGYPVTAFRAEFDTEIRPIRLLMVEAREPKRRDPYTKCSAIIKSPTNEQCSNEEAKEITINSLRELVGIIYHHIPYPELQFRRQVPRQLPLEHFLSSSGKD